MEKGKTYTRQETFLVGKDGKEYSIKEVLNATFLSIIEDLAETEGEATQEILDQCKVLDSLVNAYTKLNL